MRYTNPRWLYFTKYTITWQSNILQQTWSWKRQPPNPQTQQNTKYSSYHSFGQSCGVFSGVRIHSSKLHSIWRWLMSATGVIFLNRERIASRHAGTYLSNSIIRLARSDCASRVSIQLLTYLCKYNNNKVLKLTDTWWKWRLQFSSFNGHNDILSVFLKKNIYLIYLSIRRLHYTDPAPPGYLADDCQLVADARVRQLRSADTRTFVVSRTRSSFGDRTFAAARAAGPLVWNSLPCAQSQTTWAVIRPVQAVTGDIFIWTVRTRHSVNCFKLRRIEIFLLTYLLRSRHVNYATTNSRRLCNIKYHA